MAINIAQGFTITAAQAVDTRLLLSKLEMRELQPGTGNWSRQPEKYFCVCTDDLQIYTFNKNNTPSAELGYFQLCVNTNITIEYGSALTYAAVKALVDAKTIVYVKKDNLIYTLAEDLSSSATDPKYIFECTALTEGKSSTYFITVKPSGYTAEGPYYGENNAYEWIKQKADYLFETQYTTKNIDYDYANAYFKALPRTTISLGKGSWGKDGSGCTAIYKDGKVLRQLDWYYNNEPDFIVRRKADPEASNPLAGHTGIHASVAVSSGTKDLTKEVVESGAYNRKYKMVPMLISSGINDAGLMIEQNVVQAEAFELNPTVTEAIKQCAAPLICRAVLDYCDNLDDVETFFNTMHIYPTSAMAYNSHFMVAQGTEWRVIEITPTGHTTVTQGTGTNQMPHGVMTNFRTTGLMFTDNDVEWNTIETYGIGAERYDIATQAFATTPKTLDELRLELAYTKSYSTGTEPNPKWLTEYCGMDNKSGHILEVMDAKTDPSLFNAIYAEGVDNYINRTREDGKGTWQTTSSCIYNLSEKCFNIAIQERFTETFDFYLNESSGPSGSGVMERDFTTRTDVGYLNSGTAISSTDKINDVLYKMLYGDDTETISTYYGAVTGIPTGVTGLTQGNIPVAELISGTYTIRIVSGDASDQPQRPVFAIPHGNANEAEYQIVAWCPTTFPYNIEWECKWVLDSSNVGYNLYYLKDPVMDKYETPPGTEYRIRIKKI